MITSLRTFLKLLDSFYMMMFYGESILDMKLVYYTEEASYFKDHGALHRAAASYRKALRLDPDNFYAHAGLTYYFAGHREFQRALQHADRALESKTGDVTRNSRITLNLLRLVIFQMLERDDEAKAVLDRLLLSLKGDLPVVYNRLAYIYLDLGIYDKAAHYSNEAIAIQPEEQGFYQNLAQVYLEEGRPEKARESLLKARELAGSSRQRRIIDRRIRKIAAG